MRKIEFKPSVSGTTKIFVDNKELATVFDPNVFRQFRINRTKLPPVTGQNIVDTITKKLLDDHITLAKDEINFIVKYVKEELGL